MYQNDFVEDPDNVTDNDINGYNKVRAAVHSSLENEAEKAAFLCRRRYIKEGETNCKYFFQMSKRDYVQKTMYKVRKSNGKLTKDYSEILEVQQNFYQDLYCSNPEIRFNIENTSGIFLSHDETKNLDRPILEEELWDALFSIKPNKAPGCTGLTRQFYIKF